MAHSFDPLHRPAGPPGLCPPSAPGPATAGAAGRVLQRLWVSLGLGLALHLGLALDLVPAARAQDAFEDPFASPGIDLGTPEEDTPIEDPAADPAVALEPAPTPIPTARVVEPRLPPAALPAAALAPAVVADPFAAAGVPPAYAGAVAPGAAAAGVEAPYPLPDAAAFGLPPAPPEPDIDPIERARREALRQTFPLTPDEIYEFGDQMNATGRASTRITRPPADVPPYTSVEISLEPGVQPPVLYTGVGEVSALSFFDLTGSPYPIASVVVGNPNQFSVAVPNDGGNLITITPLIPFAYGNIVVSLLDQPVPIVLQLVAGEGKVNYRVDMRVLARGPQAPDVALVPDTDPVPGGANLAAFLDNVSPDGTRRLTLRGGPGVAWQQDETVFVRTPLTILSPGWLNRAAGPAGIFVYELPASPVLRASDDGQIVTLTLEGLEE